MKTIKTDNFTIFLNKYSNIFLAHTYLNNRIMVNYKYGTLIFDSNNKLIDFTISEFEEIPEQVLNALKENGYIIDFEYINNLYIDKLLNELEN